jgi:hypothetical protein
MLLDRMPHLCSIVEWLDKTRSLWEFLTALGTAVGTVGAVIVSLWLALGERRARLKIFAGVVNEGKTVLLEITNRGASALVLHCYWRAPCLGSVRAIGLPDYPCELNERVALRLPQRLQRDDVLVTWAALDGIAKHADEVIPEGIKGEGLEVSLSESFFGCVTSSGKEFEIAAPESAWKDIARRVTLLRTEI